MHRRMIRLVQFVLRLSTISFNRYWFFRCEAASAGAYFLERLAAFQEAGVKIRVRMATPEEAAKESWKFTTTNNGTSVRVRGKQ